MSLITIFTALKPFKDKHINIIQRNAIQSWLQLGDEVEVLLIGNEEGVSTVAEEFGLQNLPQVQRNEAGTPLISSIFSLAEDASQSPLLAYVNADMLLLPDFIETARQVMAMSQPFLIVGQRWDMDVNDPLVFSNGWVEAVKEEVVKRGKLHPPVGSDYFIFPRDTFKNIPDFAVGRAGWDNWMIYHALRQAWLAVDASPSITAIHQNHDYSHLPGGEPHYRHEETFTNQKLAGGAKNMFMLLDIDKQIQDGRLQPAPRKIARLLRKFEYLLFPKEMEGIRWELVRRIRRLRRKMMESYD